MVLAPVLARYRRRGLALQFRGDAAFAKPELYELLEAEGIRYAMTERAGRADSVIVASARLCTASDCPESRMIGRLAHNRAALATIAWTSPVIS